MKHRQTRMIPLLRIWNSRHRVASFDPSSGRWTVRRAPKEFEPSTRGWAFRYDGQWYAFWHENGGTALFAAGQKWCPDPNVVVTNLLEGAKRTFSIRRAGELVVEIKYRSHARRLFARLDSTYDAVDEELDDFFLMAAVWMNG